MCYAKPGPRCSAHASERYLKAYSTYKVVSTNPMATPQAILIATEELQQAEREYDMTPRRQEQLRQVIQKLKEANYPSAHISKIESQLEEGRRSRAEALQAIKEIEQGDITRQHQSSVTNMSFHDEQAPSLSIPLEGEVGRVYRYPGSNPLPTGPNGGIILPSEEEARANIRAGLWVPSITNIVDVRNKPHLINWASRKALREAIDAERLNPGYLVNNTEKALQRFYNAGDRERDESAAKGTVIHYACELIANGHDVPQGLLSPSQAQAVQRYREWTEEFQPEIIGTEVTVFGTTPHGNYAGTADLLCRINGSVVALDIKTNKTGLHTDVAYQLSAICHADKVSLDGGKTLQDMPRVDAAYGLHLNTTAYTFAPVVVDGEPWETFQGERAVWEQHVFEGLQRDDTPVISPAVRQRDMVIPTR